MTVTSGQSQGTIELTPSGIPVYFASAPKRHYRVGVAGTIPEALEAVRSDPVALQGYVEDWPVVPSVTEVLGVLDKSAALVWWAQRIGMQGALALMNEGLLHDDLDAMIDLLTQKKITVNHQRDKAGDRGQAVHDALESWARNGHMPDPSIYPPEQEGYVRGLVAFLRDIPSAEPVGAEVLVASAEHGYAGRYDLRLRTNAEHEVVVRQTATKVRRRPLAPGLLLADLKTSKSAYPTHALQLAAYELASIESGYEPTEGRGVLLVSPEGHYEFKRAKAQPEDFLAVLEVWRRLQKKGEWL